MLFKIIQKTEFDVIPIMINQNDKIPGVILFQDMSLIMNPLNKKRIGQSC